MGFWDEVSKWSQALPVVGTYTGAIIDAARATHDGDPKTSFQSSLIDAAKNQGEAAQELAGIVGNAPVVKPSLSLLSKEYSYGLARPVSSALQVYGGLEQGAPINSVFGSKTWQQAWENSKTVSPGQALIKDLATGEANTPGVNDSSMQQQLGTNVPFAKLAAVGDRGNERFNTQFSLASGTVDSLMAWNLDPLVLAGKGAKIAREAKTTLKAGDVQGLAPDATDLTRRQAAVRKDVDKFVSDTDGYTASELMRFKAFKNNAVLADAFAAADGQPEVKKLVLRYAMGDTTAGDALRAQADYVAARMERMTADLDSTVFAPELAAPGSLFDFHNQQQDIDALLKERQSNTRLMDMYQRLLPDDKAAADAEKLGVALDRHSIGAFGSVGERPAISTGSLGDRLAGRGNDLADLTKERQYVIQDGVGDLPVRFSKQLTGRRPAGMIDLHDPEQGFEELSNMLRRVRGLQPAQRQAMLDGYVHAPDDNARQLAIQAIEQRVMNHIGDSLGLHPDDVTSIFRKVQMERGEAIQRVKERAYTGATDENGITVDALRLEDGTLIHRPLLETHLANRTPTLDVDHVYRVLKHNSSRISALRAGAGKTFDVVEDAGMLVNDLWKFQTLLRLGYLQRNVIDNQMRLFGYMGGKQLMVTMAQNVGQGLQHKLSSISALRARGYAATQLEASREALAKKLAGRPLDQTIEGDPEIEALADEVEKWETVVKNGPDPEEYARHFGQGEIQVGDYTRPDAFGKRLSEYERNREQVSGEEMWANFAGGEIDRQLNKMRSDDFITVDGTNPLYVEHYLRVVNNQIRQSEVGKMLLEGRSPQDVIAWLKSPAGRKLRRRLVHQWDSPEELVQANAVNINHVIPDPAMQRTLLERPLRQSDVSAMFPGGQHTRPAINAGQIGFAIGTSKTARAYATIRDGYFRWMSSMPDNIMGRHPLYRQMYRGRLRQLMTQADPKLEGELTTADQRVLDEQARVWARREMKRIMFDVSSKSNVAHWMRFMAPFTAAWEDAMVKYGRLVMRDPSLLPRAWDAWTAPNDLGLVVDQNGNPVDSAHSKLTDNEYIRLPAGFLGKRFSQGMVSISKSSLNIALQGDPFWLPGFGPMVQAPVNEVAKDRPSLEQSVKFILPYGTEDAGFLSYKKFLSSGIRNASKGEGDRQYSRMLVQIAQTETERYRQGLRDKPPTPQEIADRTKALYSLKVATSFLSPFSIQYNSPYQFYIDEYHRYQQKYGLNADSRFLKDKGEDFYIFATSLSKNTTGIQSTQRADTAARGLKDLIAKAPSYGWFFVGPDNTGSFSQSVYTAQQLRRVSPTSTETYRGTYTPDEALARNNAELGWIEYQKLNQKIGAILTSRGLTSLQQKGAEDLAQIKQLWMQQVTGKNGPAWGHDWYNDFQARDDGTVRKFLEAAKLAVDDPRTAKRPDIQVMAQYLDARTKFQAILAARKAAGGSASLSAKANADLASIWSQITGTLVAQNVTFEDTYNRMLENDDLTARIN